MKIVIDRNIPFISAPLSTIGEVIPLPGTAITAADVRDADILLTRTRTKCDASLLEGSRCRFIGTATIGTDHIDLTYCRTHGIKAVNAPGCNAPAVAQWVLAAVKASLAPGEKLSDKTIGVIGAGNVGSILIRWAEGLGMKVLVNDPPLEEKGDRRHDYTTLARIAGEADVITVHTPLTLTGPHPTHHRLGEEFISGLKRRPLLLNAARGAVADTEALKKGMRLGLISAVGIDCWEGEPEIDRELLGMAMIATPHIAGYSREGKIRASAMVLDSLSDFLELPRPLRPDAPALNPVPETIGEDDIRYDILADTAMLRDAPGSFEELRNNYILRPEPKIAVRDN